MNRAGFRAFGNRYAVEILFVQLLAVFLNVLAAVLNLTKLFGFCH